jgi:hypothetical protein
MGVPVTDDKKQPPVDDWVERCKRIDKQRAHESCAGEGRAGSEVKRQREKLMETQKELETVGRVIARLDGVSSVSEPEVIDVGWTMLVTISGGLSGWYALAELKTAGGDLLLVNAEPVDASEFDFRLGVVWQCSQDFVENVAELVAVERWLETVGARAVAVGKTAVERDLPPRL